MSFGIARGKQLVTDGYGIDGGSLPPFDPADRTGSHIDPREWFADPAAPLEIEIGSGKGTFLVQQAELTSDVNYLGIEYAGEFYRYAADRLRRRAIDNARILHTDAVEFLRYRCPPALTGVVHLYFSDPWPKTRHHKRRVVQDRFLVDMHRILRPGGELRLVTDHETLWAWYEDHASRHGRLFTRHEFAAPASAAEGELVGTNYERKFADEGRPFFAMCLRRVDDARV